MQIRGFKRNTERERELERSHMLYKNEFEKPLKRKCKVRAIDNLICEAF